MAKQGRTIGFPMIWGACVPVVEKFLRFCRLSPSNTASGTQLLHMCSFSRQQSQNRGLPPEIPALSQAFAANRLFRLKKPAVLQFCSFAVLQGGLFRLRSPRKHINPYLLKKDGCRPRYMGVVAVLLSRPQDAAAGGSFIRCVGTAAG
jgi:hypothetical protein